MVFCGPDDFKQFLIFQLLLKHWCFHKYGPLKCIQFSSGESSSTACIVNIALGLFSFPPILTTTPCSSVTCQHWFVFCFYYLVPSYLRLFTVISINFCLYYCNFNTNSRLFLSSFLPSFPIHLFKYVPSKLLRNTNVDQLSLRNLNVWYCLLFPHCYLLVWWSDLFIDHACLHIHWLASNADRFMRQFYKCCFESGSCCI